MDKRFIVGVAYNLLIGDDEQRAAAGAGTLDVRAAAGSVDAVYRQADVRIPHSVGADDAWMAGAPLHLSHRAELGAVGRVLSSRVRGDRVEVVAEVTHPDVIRRLDAGALRGLSVNYTVDTSRRGRDRYTFHELSVCETPHFAGCEIQVLAARDLPEAPGNKHGSYLDARARDPASRLFAPPPPARSMASSPSAPAPADPMDVDVAKGAAAAPAKAAAAAAAPAPATPAPPAPAAAAAPPAEPSLAAQLQDMQRQNAEIARELKLTRELMQANQRPHIVKTQQFFQGVLAPEGADPAAHELPPVLRHMVENAFGSPELKEVAETFIKMNHHVEALRERAAAGEAERKSAQSELRKAHAEAKQAAEERDRLVKQLQDNPYGHPPAISDVFGLPPSSSLKRGRGADSHAASALVGVRASADGAGAAAAVRKIFGPPDLDDMLAQLQGLPAEPLHAIREPFAKRARTG